MLRCRRACIRAGSCSVFAYVYCFVKEGPLIQFGLCINQHCPVPPESKRARAHERGHYWELLSSSQ
jgi:hypothetical protein